MYQKQDKLESMWDKTGGWGVEGRKEAMRKLQEMEENVIRKGDC
jgi:hypothetical protein